MHLLAFLGLFPDRNDRFLFPFMYLQLAKFFPFHMPAVWKLYPFRTEPPRLVHNREYPAPGMILLELQLLSFFLRSFCVDKDQDGTTKLQIFTWPVVELGWMIYRLGRFSIFEVVMNGSIWLVTIPLGNSGTSPALRARDAELFKAVLSRG